MRHLSMWALILCLPITFGCQRLIDLSSGEGTYVDPGTQQGSANRGADFVADRDGNLYAISCLRQERDQIVAGGQEAAEGCRLGNIKTRTLSKGVKEGRGFWAGYGFYGGYWSNWYIYPPYYWSGSSNSSSSTNLCYYIFGSTSSSFNCYSDLFNFDPYDYSDFWQPCDYCLYRANPTRCQNRCWYRNSWYWY